MCINTCLGVIIEALESTVYQCLCRCHCQVIGDVSVSILCINTYVGVIIKSLDMSEYKCLQILIHCLSDLIKIEIIKIQKLIRSHASIMPLVKQIIMSLVEIYAIQAFGVYFLKFL